jgi:hypothetical protein
MDWIKIPTDNILNSEFKNSELLALIKYQALYCQLEKEPTEMQLKRILNAKEFKFVQSYSQVAIELIQSQIKNVKQKRKRDKESYQRKQEVSKNSDVGKLSNRELSGGAEKRREEKIKKETKKDNQDKKPNIDYQDIKETWNAIAGKTGLPTIKMLKSLRRY